MSNSEDLEELKKVKERGILFSGEMVRAILDGRKTQTRRLCKEMNRWDNQTCREVRHIDGVPFCFMVGASVSECRLRCPYGQPGDRLWVRESFWGCDMPGYEDVPCVVYDDEWRDGEYHAAAVRPYARRFGRTPSIHMPREASRITLEITDVKVERIRDISVADALAEGCCVSSDPDEPTSFHNTWNACYPGSWDRNDWVWVITFNPLPPKTSCQ